jgi:hypothetical protein
MNVLLPTISESISEIELFEEWYRINVIIEQRKMIDFNDRKNKTAYIGRQNPCF